MVTRTALMNGTYVNSATYLAGCGADEKDKFRKL
jgi:hypothetical protein